MIRYLKNGWKSILKIGYNPSQSGLEKNRTMSLNGIVSALAIMAVLFSITYKIAGFRYYYGPLFVIPISFIVLTLNKVRRYRAAKNLFTIGTLLVIGYWCFKERRIGAEYILITVATTSTLIYSSRAIIYLINFSCIGIVILYKAYDFSGPFVPDPSINYEIEPLIILACTIALLSYQMAFFKDLTQHYGNKLSVRYNELGEALELNQKTTQKLSASREEYRVLSEQLEWIVKQKSEELQSYLDAINVHIFSAVTDKNGTMLKVNQPLIDITGFTRDELLGKNFRIFNSEQHSNDYFQNLFDSMLEGKTWRGEIQNKMKDGSLFWMDMVIMPLKNERGAQTYFLILALPITERKEAEEQKERTTRMLESIAFRASHQVRGPIARIQGLMNLMDKGYIQHHELETISALLKDNISEMDIATRDLTSFVNGNYESPIPPLMQN
jgi:PAS domain S-box-containing protein